MSTLRSNINVKALGLHWRYGCILAAEVYDSRGRVAGVRPLGGTVEFGESSEVALRREFNEELGVEVQVLSGPLVIENIYRFEGENGHEIIFVFEVGLPSTITSTETITFQESDGTSGTARWYDPEQLDGPGFPRLYPEGLKALLTKWERLTLA
jgi:ADP-ribose pyrophosphatase YjhB (NUDIX family)